MPAGGQDWRRRKGHRDNYPALPTDYKHGEREREITALLEWQEKGFFTVDGS